MTNTTSQQYATPEIPDGEYVAEIVKVDIGKSKTKANLRARFCFEIKDAEHSGKKDWKTAMLHTVAGREQLKKELAAIDLVFESFEDVLANVEAKTLGLRIRVSVNSNEWRSIYFLGRADQGVVNGTESEALNTLSW